MLYLVPTPIGNMRDITLRALDVMNEADILACEDTRHTGRLLKEYDIKANLVSMHDHVSDKKIESLVEAMQEGKSVALISDAGSPLISDPGFPLVRRAIELGIQVEALPGPTAVTTALTSSGLSSETFSFWGFLPQKQGARRKKLEELVEHEETLIFYESPYRVVKALEDMQAVLGNREAVVSRELTKKFEEIQRGDLATLCAELARKKMMGEFVILVAGYGRKKVFEREEENE